MTFGNLCGFRKLWVGSGIDTPESSSPKDDSQIPDYYLPRLSHLLPVLQASSLIDPVASSDKPV